MIIMIFIREFIKDKENSDRLNITNSIKKQLKYGNLNNNNDNINVVNRNNIQKFN